MRKYVSFLIKPASSCCNLRCRYCFYFDEVEHRELGNHGIMQETTMHNLIDKALAIGKDAEINFSFQGGEPTLAGLNYFEKFIEYTNAHKDQQIINYALQTNGYLIDERWCKFFKENNFLIGVSLDGYDSLHNYFRKNINLEDTYKRVFKSIELLKEYQVDFNILTVLTSTLSKHPDKLFKFYKKNDLHFIQFIPCIPGLDEEKNEYSLTPCQFSAFYKRFFDNFKQELYSGNYISVNLFDNLISLFAGEMGHQCGLTGRCTAHLVIEGSGDVYPCDFYSLDEYKCGNINENSLEEIVSSKVINGFTKEERRPCKVCLTCPFKPICNRNCKRLNVAYYDEDYCGYRDFIEYAYKDLIYISRHLKRR